MKISIDISPRRWCLRWVSRLWYFDVTQTYSDVVDYHSIKSDSWHFHWLACISYIYGKNQMICQIYAFQCYRLRFQVYLLPPIISERLDILGRIEFICPGIKLTGKDARYHWYLSGKVKVKPSHVEFCIDLLWAAVPYLCKPFLGLSLTAHITSTPPR